MGYCPCLKRKDNPIKTTTSCLPEIRHKTAVSTIRSTAEKATREKTNKLNTTESRRKGLHKQDPQESRRKGLHKQDPQGTPGPKCDRNKSSSNKDSNRRPPSSNHKKCSRYEASLK
ncbi:hypothetical protein QE152_g25263 [Popillia japonica]|uniref:Uncharacterized protein n=1 Tax=Popillia japonica TaxID=7064 RepID=A0AAW1K3F3_POPJA